jgi:hypothetical protein
MAFSQKTNKRGEHSSKIIVAQKLGTKKSQRFNKQVSERFGISMAVPVENFADKYEFRKQPRARSPIQQNSWEADVFDDPDQDVVHGKHAEARMVRGEPSGYKCHERSSGSLRLSGGLKGRKAHQIGKRK